MRTDWSICWFVPATVQADDRRQWCRSVV